MHGEQGDGGGHSKQGPPRLLRRLHISKNNQCTDLGLPTILLGRSFTKNYVTITSLKKWNCNTLKGSRT